MAINRRVCNDYLTVADLLPSLVFVFHQNSHEPNRGCSMTVPMKDNVSEGNKERSNCFKNSNYMDDLAARWKCRSVWNCESHFASEIRPVCAKNGWCLGVCVGGGGGRGVNLTLGLFLETITHRRLTKLTYPRHHHPPTPEFF